MISFDVKPETSSSSPLSGLLSKEVRTTLSFSELLQGASLKKTDTKIVQNGALVLSLEKELESAPKDTKSFKNETLLSLLKGETLKSENIATIVQTDVNLELNPQVTQSLNLQDLKTLIHDAKQYLKNKIVQSDAFKRTEIEALPKTLKGLVQVAKKFGVELSKITLEEVKISSKNTPIKSINTATALLKVHKINAKDTAQENNPQLEESLQILPKQKHGVKTTTPLFKAQTQGEHTTEQLVQTKILSTEKKVPQKKVDETLKSLLSGDKALKKETTLTADFSVASAKVIAPKTTRETENSFESLLKGEGKESSQLSKLDGLATSKADSFEVKIHEAKQMTKYLSQDVKQAIEDYKSPFTRIKVQLNPQKLGEIDLTIIQRGKNLHINLSSNNVAINTLALNAQDLKTQLANSGINNASLNFNNNPQSDQSGANQQQQRHQEQKAQDEYNYFETQESKEDILSSLEIVVPHYA